jgi:hypothetical protein
VSLCGVVHLPWQAERTVRLGRARVRNALGAVWQTSARPKRPARAIPRLFTPELPHPPIFFRQPVFHRRRYERAVGPRGNNPLLSAMGLENVFLASARSCCRWRDRQCRVPRPCSPTTEPPDRRRTTLKDRGISACVSPAFSRWMASWRWWLRAVARIRFRTYAVGTARGSEVLYRKL